MCGISGVIIRNPNGNKYYDLLKVSDIRGQDGTGICILRNGEFIVKRWDCRAQEITDFPELQANDIVMGQNRLAIFGLTHDNDQPLVTEKTALLHNGQLYHFEEAFAAQPHLKRELTVDTELILRMFDDQVKLYLSSIIEEQFVGDGVAEALNDVFCNPLVKGNAAMLLLYRGTHFITSASFDKPLWRLDCSDRNTYFFSTHRIGMKVFSEEEMKYAYEYAFKEIRTDYL